jgi:hypothetical protein
MTTDCNLVFGRIMLPCVKLDLMVLFSTSFFLIFRFYDQLTLLSFVMVSLLVFTTLLLIVPTTIVMSSLYKTSKAFTFNVKPCIHNLKDTTQKEILKRTIRSCATIRCEVGGLYYMETKAKLTVIHKLVNGLKYLLVNVKV